MKAGEERRMASLQTGNSKALFTGEDKMELVLIVEYSSVDSTDVSCRICMLALKPVILSLSKS